MSISYLIHFPIENASLNMIPLIRIVFCKVESMLLHLLPNPVETVRKFLFLSRTQSFNESQFYPKTDEVVKDQDFELSNQLPCSSEKKIEDGYLCREDVETVMARLEFFCNPEDEKLQERFGSNDLSNLFEEKEPSLEEVKGAFDVFDENRDGFIDAKELQTVLCALGFKKESEIENCKRMLSVFNKNGDGRIDFSEFVKFMENIFC